MTPRHIDTHHHLWDLTRVAYPWLTPADGPLYRTFMAPELAPQLQAAGIDQTVLVQSANSLADTEFMLEQADSYGWIGAVVGWVPLLDPDATAAALARWQRHPKFRGIRHLIHNEADPDWVIQAQVIESLRIVAAHHVLFEVVAVFPDHLKHVPTLAERVPDLTLVIDHLGKPPIREQRFEPWASQLRAAAAAPQVYAKVSGLTTAAPTWSVADLQPYVDHALACFGAERLMFGSDWPVCTLAGEYAQVWAATQESLVAQTPRDRDRILGETAAQVYHL